MHPIRRQRLLSWFTALLILAVCALVPPLAGPQAQAPQKASSRKPQTESTDSADDARVETARRAVQAAERLSTKPQPIPPIF